MKIDTERLREDLRAYARMAVELGLPCAAEDPEALARASEEELVDLAATQGWDLGKYVR